MVLSGGALCSALVVLASWFSLLTVVFSRLVTTRFANTEPQTRRHLATAGMGFACVAVGCILLFHLTWVSPSFSQNLGPAIAWVLSFCTFLSTVAGLFLSMTGSGRTRFLGIGTCLFTGLWWVTLYAGAAISMGAPIARHPTRFLIPDGPAKKM